MAYGGSTPLRKVLPVLLVKYRGNLDRGSKMESIRLADSCNQAALMDTFDATCVKPKGIGTLIKPRGQVLDHLVHELDIRRPLGINGTIEPALLIGALNAVATATSKLFAPAKTTNGLRLVAPDIAWSSGPADGPVVEGPAEDLLLAVSGRRIRARCPLGNGRRGARAPYARRLMDFTWTAEQQELRERARQVAERGVARYGRFNDCWINGFSKGFSKELAAEGFIGMTWPTQYGGGGRPPIDRLIVAEELISAGAPIAATWFADRQMGPTLINYGSAEQIDRWLPDMLAGDTTWCIGMSEPNAGSDLASLQTRADRHGDHFVINGQKIWTSFGALADCCYLICRTSSEGPLHAGISEIVVPMDTPGIEVREIQDMTTNRHFCEVFYDDVKVPVENLVGVEGAAFKQTMRQLEHERGGIDRLLSNHAIYRHARKRADTTNPLVRQEIAALESAYRIGRILVTREVLRQAPAGFSAATKCFCTEHQQRVADFVARTLGADAMVWDQITQGIVYNPAYTIMGGTSNVLRNILGERVLGLPKEPAAR